MFIRIIFVFLFEFRAPLYADAVRVIDHIRLFEHFSYKIKSMEVALCLKQRTALLLRERTFSPGVLVL